MLKKLELKHSDFHVILGQYDQLSYLVTTRNTLVTYCIQRIASENSWDIAEISLLGMLSFIIMAAIIRLTQTR